MDQPVRLVPLVCPNCSMRILAQPGEVAWVCSQCRQGWLLTEQASLTSLEVNYSAAIPANQPGKPYWVTRGKVDLTRQVFSGSNKENDALKLWGAPRLFIIPAFPCPLEALLNLGPRLLLQPPSLDPGPPASFSPVTISPADVKPLAEFIVLAIEASRQDKLKSIHIALELETPSLWVLP